MGTTYSITMHQNNGTDYDTLNPATTSSQVIASSTIVNELGIPAGSSIDAALSGIIHTPVICTFTTANWQDDGKIYASGYNGYTQTVDCAGLLATDDYRTRVVPVGNATSSDEQSLTDAAYMMVNRFSCDTNGKLTARVYATAKPTVDFQVAVVISR